MKSKTKTSSGGTKKPSRPNKPGMPDVPVPDPYPGTTKMPTLKNPHPWPPPKKERPR